MKSRGKKGPPLEESLQFGEERENKDNPLGEAGCGGFNRHIGFSSCKSRERQSGIKYCRPPKNLRDGGRTQGGGMGSPSRRLSRGRQGESCLCVYWRAGESWSVDEVPVLSIAHQLSILALPSPDLWVYFLSITGKSNFNKELGM